ncbi:fibronectin type III domain-containing protein [[Eubacterium] cellulosolvens]
MDLVSIIKGKFRIKFSFKVLVIILVILLGSINFVTIRSPDLPEVSIDKVSIDKSSIHETVNEKSLNSQAVHGSRGPRALSFTENSTGLPSTGGYNFVGFGDINNDNNIDMTFGAENYGSPTNQGVFVYTGNGGTSWSSASTGLWPGNSWGGLALADADGDGYIELYAPDEHWGTDNSSGLKVWEYRSGSWTDSTSHVSTPFSSGTPNNVVLTNITGDNRLDMVVCNSSSYGLVYFENKGNNPVTWQSRSSGLRSSSEFTAFAVEDMNKDGLKDIVSAWYANGGQHMYIQQTSGNLWQNYNTGLTVPYPVLGTSIGDVNNDGHMDVLWGTRDNGIRCKLGNSGGVSGTSFSWTNANTGLPTSGRYAQIQVVDIDLDGDLDLVAPEGASNSIGIRIYLGNGSTNPVNFGWTMASNTNLTTSGYWYGVNCFDINRDGSLDIAAASWGNGVKCYLNTLKGIVDNTPPGAVNDLIATNATTNSITINWTAPADNGSSAASGPVQSYDIRYSTSNINLGNWASATQCPGLPTPASPGTKQNYTITGLSSATQYYIALRSQDELPNLSPLSNILINSTRGIYDTFRPGQIADLQAKEPTNNSINLTWTAPADNGSIAISGPVTGYEIRYNTTEITNLTWSAARIFPQAMIPNTPGTLESIMVTGLAPTTTYYFAVKARDERPNWGWVSNSDHNTTLPDPDIVPPAAVSDLVAENPSDTTINLTWTAVGDDGNNGIATSYDIRYSTLSITDGTWSSATECTNEPLPNSTGTIEHFQVTGLPPNTKYYFAIKVADETPRWSGLSNIASNTTLTSMDTTPPGQITDLTTSQPSSISVVLTWTAPGDNGNSGTVSGYDIRYSIEPITDALWGISSRCNNYPTPKSAGQEQVYTVTGLISSTKYYFAVKAFDERPNYGLLSNIANATTLSSSDTTPPAGITNLAGSAISSNSVKLTWTAPGDDGTTGTVTGYDIRYSTTQINDSVWADATQVADEPLPQPASAPETFTVTGLFAGTKYYFAIKSYDERPNYSILSNIASATTYSSDDSIAPAKIDDLAVAETSETTATLTWTAVGDDGKTGSATAYELRFEKSEINDLSWRFATKIMGLPQPKPAGENETFLVTGLDPNTEYFFAMKAADEAPNWSPLSNSASGTTKGKSLPGLTATLQLAKTTLEGGESTSLSITVLTEETSQPVEQANVELTSNDASLELTPSSSFTAPNGKLTIIVKAPEVTSETEVTIYAEITKTGFKSLTSETIFTVVPKQVTETRFNLRVTTQSITFSKTAMVEGDMVTIYANITNLGPDTASEFLVRFLIDGVQVGDDIQVSELQANLFIKLEKTWLATEGVHILRVEIIPTETTFETDESDNHAEVSVTIRGKLVDDGKDEEDDHEGSSDLLLWLILLIVVIVIIIGAGYGVAHKKRKSEPAFPEHERQPPEVPPEYAPSAEPMPEPAMQMEESILEPGTGTEQIIPHSAEFQETTLQEPASSEEPGQAPEIETLEASSMAPEQLQTQPADAEDEVKLESHEIGGAQGTETGTQPTEQQIAEPEPELEPEQGPDQPEATAGQQLQLCPVCQNMIPVFATPCPQCGSELNWG